MWRLICDLCGVRIPPHAHYIVKIEIFADPTMPPITSEEIEELDLDQKMKDLLEEMKNLSADDLQDQVHREFQFRLCRPCQIRFIANPLGLPRQRKQTSN